MYKQRIYKKAQKKKR